MSLVYVDTVTNWLKFVPFLNDREFIRNVQKYAEWIGVPYEQLSEHSIAECHNKYLPIDDYDDHSSNELVAKANAHGPTSVYWWSYLQDDIDGSALIMAPLLKLALKRDVYIVNLQFKNETGNVRRQVVSDRYFGTGVYSTVDQSDDNEIPRLYDLMFSEHSPKYLGAKIHVTRCEPLQLNHRGMNYWGTKWVNDIHKTVNTPIDLGQWELRTVKASLKHDGLISYISYPPDYSNTVMFLFKDMSVNNILDILGLDDSTRFVRLTDPSDAQVICRMYDVSIADTKGRTHLGVWFAYALYLRSTNETDSDDNRKKFYEANHLNEHETALSGFSADKQL